MFNSFLAQILVLFLLYISALRMFFLREPRIDAAAVASPFAFLVSLLIFPIWGFSIQAFLLLGISFLFFLTNIRAILRVMSELLIDQYSIPYIIATIIELILLILVSIFIVYFRPVRYSTRDFSIQKEILEMNGNFANGFRLELEYKDKMDGRVSGKIFVYTPIEKIEWISSEDSIFNKPENSVKSENEVVAKTETENQIKTETETTVAENEVVAKTENNEVKSKSKSEVISANEAPLLLFVGTPYSPVESYEPYLMFLAQKGFTVLAADFFPIDYNILEESKNSRIMKKFTLLQMFIHDKEKFDSLKPKILEFTKKGYEVLSRLALVNFRNDDESQKKIFYLTDGLDSDSIFSFSDKFKGQVSGFFQLDLISEYKTSGFGFPEQTNLLLAYNLGIKRDSEFFIPRYLSFKTIQKIAIEKNRKEK